MPSKQKIPKTWQNTVVAEDGTHHLLHGQPYYTERFIGVMKFHAPGLAPVIDTSGAYHIDSKCQPLYSHRYVQTFGYYQHRAAVEGLAGCWFHLDTQGQRCYPEDYAWCGNFQGDYCPVKNKQTHHYYHIDKRGNRIYPDDYAYVGDYREGFAVVCRHDGLQTHIDNRGKYLHNRWFLGVDVFHKNIARAQDEQGWFHINRQGLSLYQQRYKVIEPFYNNIAVVEHFDGSLFTIDTTGKQVHLIRAMQQNTQQLLSADLVSFWKTQTIYAAVKLKLFDYLPNTANVIAAQIKLTLFACKRLLRALQELDLVDIKQDHSWSLTTKGKLLQPSATSPMAAASRVWGESHYQTWPQLADMLLKPRAKTHIYFENLANDSILLPIYHTALKGYATQDYVHAIKAIDWARHHYVIDAGGGTGGLITMLLDQQPHLRGILLEKKAVINLVEQRHMHCQYISTDLQKSWPCQSVDAIILARVLHDWPKKEAINLLAHAKNCLLPNGKIYVLEMVLKAGKGDGGLLDLNMLVMTGGQERSLPEWRNLAKKTGLNISKITPMTNIVSLIELVHNPSPLVTA